ncbi:MAG: hypothetical protein ABSE93_10315 [Terriglobia bacterium]|jgi:hypothetical protein
MQGTQNLKNDVQAICEQLGIDVHWYSVETCAVNWAHWKERKINVREIYNCGDYAAAFHEIGHVECDAGEKQQGVLLVLQECRAWQWAIDRRKDAFDSGAWQRIGNALDCYLRDCGIDEQKAPEQWKEIMQLVGSHSIYGVPSPGSLGRKKKKLG